MTFLKTNVAGVAGVTLSKFKKIKAKQRRFLLNTLGGRAGLGLPSCDIVFHCQRRLQWWL